MTRKHFQALADALRYNRNHILIDAGLGGTVAGDELTSEALKDSTVRAWRDMAESIAGVCATSNPRFNRSRFLKACGATS